jgi:pyruvate formate lyase activating enzyme
MTSSAVQLELTSTEPRIAGLVGSGMLDWPGRLSATVFLGGCNLRCPFCHNPELVGAPKHPGSLERILDHVRAKRDWLDGIVVTGGEPTTDPALLDLLRVLKSEGLPVKLDTNGTAPALVGSLIADGLVDFVALDVKAAPARYDFATRTAGLWPSVKATIRVLIDSGVEHEFRTTCYPSAVDTADLPNIASQLAGGRRYAIQQFRPQRTLDPAAGSVRPHDPESLRRAALCCAVHLPTVVRGV